MIARNYLEHTFTVKVKGKIIELYCDGIWVSSHGTIASLTKNIQDIMDYELYELEKQKNGWWNYLGTNIK